MPAKKRGHIHTETPFDAQTVAAITRDIPGLLAKEGYFDHKPRTVDPAQVKAVQKQVKEIHTDMFSHAYEDVQISETKTEAELRTVPKPVPRGNRLKLLYIVMGFTVAIVSIWIFNARSLVSGLWSNTATENEILDQGAADFNSVLETIKNNDRIVREKLEAGDAADPVDPFTQAQVEEALREAVQPKKNP
ncbi:MAG: hypothetical protein KAZ30_01240 [Candidatus Magasanikbacteria bacterium]|nr:hypothetical protein [Candidatus Magasanikbacteria bacterium]